MKDAQDELLVRAKGNSLAQLGKYTGKDESAEAKEGMYSKNYTLSLHNFKLYMYLLMLFGVLFQKCLIGNSL